MYLKSIKLQGFKSFANPIIFEFKEGITGIVGPNGSGKSNIADAVRWVLGEQSAKQLRGGNMQDVIFAGTQSRKPLSFASVDITFDNSDHALDIGYEEVTVTRRLYRSGESEYMINKSPVRLRDIHELFYDTGIGKEGYSIIGQGQIDRILSGKPEERRELFDEAAGIVKFKRRKNASIKKLDEEQQNLLRVTDILNELSGRLGPLEKQSEAAKRFLKERDRLKRLDINLFLIDSEENAAKEKQLGESIARASEELAAAEEALGKARTEYEEMTAAVAETDAKIAAAQEAIRSGSVEGEQIKGRINLINEQLKMMDETSEGNARRRAQLEEDIKKKQEEREKVLAEKAELDGQLEKAKKAEGEQRSRAEGIEAKRGFLLAGASADREEVMRLLERRTVLKAQLERLGTTIEQVGIRAAEVDSRLLRFREEEQRAKSEGDRAKSALAETEKKAAAVEAEGEGLRAKEQELSAEIASTEEKLSRSQADYHRESSRLESLKAITEHYEGYGNAVKKVMELKGRNSGIKGVAADLLTTEKKYETAIETALGGSVRNVVTDNESTAKYLIEYLKKNAYGRVTFLPLTNVRARGSFSPAEALSETGVIGRASDLAETEPEYEALKEHLLGRYLVVDTIDHAIALGRKYRHSLYMVTLEGESFSPGGQITGGAFRHKDNFIGRKREITDCEKAIRELSAKIRNAKQAIENLRSDRTKVRDGIAAKAAEAQELRLKENTLKLTLRQSEEDIRANLAQRSSLEEESGKSRGEVSGLKEQQEAARNELAEVESEEKKRTEGAAAKEAEASELSGALAQENAVLENMRVASASIFEKCGFAEENAKRMDAELASLAGEYRSVQDTLYYGGNDKAEKEAELKELAGRLEAAAAASDQAGEESQKLNEEKKALTAKQSEFFKMREELDEHRSRLDRECYRLNSQRERLLEDMEKAGAYLWETYEMTPSEAAAERDPEANDKGALRKEQKEVRDIIKSLGNVNVGAIDEYSEVLERHTFLAAQHADLVASEQKLMGIIEELDRGMRRQFKEKFGEIEKEFDKVFKALFGGGKGRLEIDEDADILEAAISIIAEPPGKKLQNMMQLSGGEKSLTAIALLFAIQNLKPSPFCLLDEIEAALDESNVIRFAEYLHRLTKHTQFIVITHRRGTMQSADRLYGVTMQEKGISTTVSVNLVEEALT